MKSKKRTTKPKARRPPSTEEEEKVQLPRKRQRNSTSRGKAPSSPPAKKGRGRKNNASDDEGVYLQKKRTRKDSPSSRASPAPKSRQPSVNRGGSGPKSKPLARLNEVGVFCNNRLVFECARTNDKASLVELLKQKKDITNPMQPYSICDNNNNAFIEALRQGNIEIAKLLVQDKYNVDNGRVHRENTPELLFGKESTGFGSRF